MWANFQRIVEVSTQKIFNMLSNIWVWDPGSGIRKKNLFRIPDPGVKKTPDPGSATLIFIDILQINNVHKCQTRPNTSVSMLVYHQAKEKRGRHIK
jgi:hypothetical protein